MSAAIWTSVAAPAAMLGDRGGDHARAGRDLGSADCGSDRAAGAYLTHAAIWPPPSIDHARGISTRQHRGGELRMAQVTREHVVDILSRAGLTPEQERRIL